MLVAIYEGEAGDTTQQTVRIARFKTIDDAYEANPHAVSVQAYEKPSMQEPVNLLALRRPKSVWSMFS